MIKVRDFNLFQESNLNYDKVTILCKILRLFDTFAKIFTHQTRE